MPIEIYFYLTISLFVKISHMYLVFPDHIGTVVAKLDVSYLAFLPINRMPISMSTCPVLTPVLTFCRRQLTVRRRYLTTIILTRACRLTAARVRHLSCRMTSLTTSTSAAHVRLKRLVMRLSRPRPACLPDQMTVHLRTFRFRGRV